HCRFGDQAVSIAIDRGHRNDAADALVLHRAITCGDFTVDHELVPRLRMTHVIDWHVVMLAPEERHGIEFLPAAEHVERSGLTLTLGDDPVLDPDRYATVWVGLARDVTRGEDAGYARLQMLIDR